MKLKSVNNLNDLSRSYIYFLSNYNIYFVNLVVNNLIVLIIEGEISILCLFVLMDIKSEVIVSKSIQVLLKDSYNLNRE